MSETSSEEKLVTEIRNRLSNEPFYIQRLGLVAINLNYVSEFKFCIDNNHSPAQIYTAIMAELRRQNISEPEKWLELFEVPNPYD